MDRFESITKPLMWFMALLLVASVTGCGGGGGGGSPILGGGGGAGIAPTVTAVAPLNNATGVPVNNTIITAEFSEPMSPITGTASFTVTCAAPCVSPTGTVTLDATSRIATFTSAAPLTASTLYTATVTGAKSLATGLALASPYVWHFTTGLVPDTTKPRVTLTVPATTSPGPTPNVPTNTAITAAFTEDMAPATINGTSFMLTGPGVTPVAGTVTYAVGTAIATFTPTAPLLAATTYTATIKGTGATPATDLAGNALAGNQAALPAASDYIWTFTTAAAAPAGNITVLSTNPANGATTSCSGAGSSVSATFTVPSGLRMDPLTVTSGTFTVTGPGLTVVTAASVTLDAATGTIATFTPLSPLQSGVLYTATIKGGPTGVKDLAVPTANTMAVNKTWTFTPSATVCVAPISLGVAAPFAIASAAGVTNTATAPLTHIDGNVVLHPTATCNAVAVDAAGGFGACGGSAPTINGTVISPLYPDAGVTSGSIKAALNATYLSLMPANLPGATVLGCGTIGTGGGAGAGIGCAGNATLPPGVYISATASTIGVTGVLTLDAQGDPNAQFIFQAPSALTTAAGAPGVPGSQIVLINGAKASNVWWQVGSSATIGTYAIFQGNILADTSITMGTSATSCGRLLAGAVTASGAFTFDSNVVSVPGNGCPF